MDKVSEVISAPMLNLDFIYYLIYLFFKGIVDFILNPLGGKSTDINFINVYRYVSDGTVISDPDKYSLFGNGIASLYDGYSLFTPPHGLDSFGGFSGWLEVFLNNPYCSQCPSFFDLFFGGFNAILYLGVILFSIIAFMIVLKEKDLAARESLIYDMVYKKDEVNGSNKKKEKWDRILDLLNSENENDWKVAIMDADLLLEEVLEENGYHGESIGERLKGANFSSIQSAWNAHKVRNEIAHNPSYKLTQREAKIAISNFSQVFSEFYHL